MIFKDSLSPIQKQASKCLCAILKYATRQTTTQLANHSAMMFNIDTLIKYKFVLICVSLIKIKMAWFTVIPLPYKFTFTALVLCR